MKYEIGIGELALSTVYERFRTIRNFLQEISELEVTKCDASLIDVYLKNLQNGAMGAKTFNTNVSGIQFFMKFLEVKGYIKRFRFMHRITWKNRSQSTMTEVWKRMCIWKLSKTSHSFLNT